MDELFQGIAVVDSHNGYYEEVESAKAHAAYLTGAATKDKNGRAIYGDIRSGIRMTTAPGKTPARPAMPWP